MTIKTVINQLRCITANYYTYLFCSLCLYGDPTFAPAIIADNYLRQQRVRMNVMICFLVRSIWYRLRLGLWLGLGLRFTLAFITGAIVAGAKCTFVYALLDANKISNEIIFLFLSTVNCCDYALCRCLRRVPYATIFALLVLAGGLSLMTYEILLIDDTVENMFRGTHLDPVVSKEPSKFYKG